MSKTQKILEWLKYMFSQRFDTEKTFTIDECEECNCLVVKFKDGEMRLIKVM